MDPGIKLEAQMAENKNDINFDNSLISHVAETEAYGGEENTFAWSPSSHRKGLPQQPQPVQKNTTKSTFSYHPVTSFKKDEEVQNMPAVETLQKQEKPEIPTASSSLHRPIQKQQSSSYELPEDPFSGRNKNFSGYNFSGKDLRGADFSGANLSGADFSGANLAGANFENADLSDSVMSGAILTDANFNKAKMYNVLLHNADIEGALLLEANFDDLTIEELQELIEFLAVNFPQKIKLSKLNLALLDLTKIALKNLDLRGVDFTGVDFTGINIMELDLSECIITPEQIAQALGRVPTPLELRSILAPQKKKGKSFSGIDMTELFFNGHKEFGVWNTTKDKGISIESLLKTGKKVYSAIAPKPQIKDSEVLEKFNEAQHQSQQHEAAEKEQQTENLRRAIEENKRAVLEQMKLEREQNQAKEQEKQQQIEQVQEKPRERPRINPNLLQRGGHERS